MDLQRHKIKKCLGNILIFLKYSNKFIKKIKIVTNSLVSVNFLQVVSQEMVVSIEQLFLKHL